MYARRNLDYVGYAAAGNHTYHRHATYRCNYAIMIMLYSTLEPGMVISVEPGCYFNDKWLNRALANPAQAKYINSAVLDGYRGSGGCRLEDDVLITETGIENLTVAPASVEEIEAVMRKGK